MPSMALETPRLTIRSFTLDDTPIIHRILDQAFGDGARVADQAALDERRSWVQWSMLSQEWLPNMHQPPYGDRAVVLKATNMLIGAVGYVPCLAPFEQLPALRASAQPGSLATPEVGLFWAIDPEQQRRGVPRRRRPDAGLARYMRRIPAHPRLPPAHGARVRRRHPFPTADDR